MDTFVFHSSGVILSASSTLIKQKQHKMVVSSCQDSKHCESLAARGFSFVTLSSQTLLKALVNLTVTELHFWKVI